MGTEKTDATDAGGGNAENHPTEEGRDAIPVDAVLTHADGRTESLGRGAKLEENRPDFVVTDDIDDKNDNPRILEKKVNTLTRDILPAGPVAGPSGPPEDGNGVDPDDPDGLRALHEKIIRSKRGIQAHYVSLGVFLCEAQDRKVYEHAGFDNFPSYCAAPEESGGVGIDAGNRERCMRVARTFYYRLNVSLEMLMQIDKSKLLALAPHVSEENVADALADAQALGHADLRKRIQEGAYRGENPGLDAEKEKAPAGEGGGGSGGGVPKTITCPECGHVIPI